MMVWMPRSPDLAEPAPLPTIASTSTPSASHAWRHDDVFALNDQVEPSDSGDHVLPRFTWWDHVGTNEWVQYDFAEPAEISGVEVYWFDDTGRGRCRIPQAWKLLYRDGDAWKPVPVEGDLPVAKDRYNRVEFSPLVTDGLRIEARLQPEFSAGILEWRVLPAVR